MSIILVPAPERARARARKRIQRREMELYVDMTYEYVRFAYQAPFWRT